MATKPTKSLAGLGNQIRRLIFTRDAAEAEKIAKQVEDEENRDPKQDRPTSDEEPEKTSDEQEEGKTKTGDAALRSDMRKLMKTMDAFIRSQAKDKTKDEEPEKTSDEDGDPKKTEDDGDLTEPNAGKKISDEGVRTYTGDSLTEVLSRAEILSPGFRTPTFDSANNGKAVLNTKRQVLKQAVKTQDGLSVITPFTGGRTDFDKLPSHTIDAAFVGASELIKLKNNAKGIRSGVSTKDFGPAPMSVADINAKNREFWNK